MATLSRKPVANVKRRKEWMRVQRLILEMQSRLADSRGVKYPDDGLKRAKPDGGAAARAELLRLEAGGDAIVQGWAVGAATDFSEYTLAGDGTLTPYVRRLTPYMRRTLAAAESIQTEKSL